MNLNEFPSSPSEGDTYLIGNVTYKYTNGVWAVVSQVKTNFRAITERLCKEAGLNMVSGSFDEGATVADVDDVIWDEASAKVFSWRGTLPKTVAAGFDPTTNIGSVAWVDRSTTSLNALLSAIESEITIAGMLAKDLAPTDPRRWGAHPITETGYEAFDSTQAFQDAIDYAKANGLTEVVFEGRYLIDEALSTFTLPYDDGTIYPSWVGTNGDVNLTAETAYTMPVCLTIDSNIKLRGKDKLKDVLIGSWNIASSPIDINQKICLLVTSGSKYDGTIRYSLENFTIEQFMIGRVVEGTAEASSEDIKFISCGISGLIQGVERRFEGEMEYSGCMSGDVHGGWWTQRNNTRQTAAYMPPYPATDVFAIGWTDYCLTKNINYSQWSGASFGARQIAIDAFFDTYFFKSANSALYSAGGRLSNNADATYPALMPTYYGICGRARTVISRYGRTMANYMIEGIKTLGCHRTPVHFMANTAVSPSSSEIKSAYIERTGLIDITTTTVTGNKFGIDNTDAYRSASYGVGYNVCKGWQLGTTTLSSGNQPAPSHKDGGTSLTGQLAVNKLSSSTAVETLNSCYLDFTKYLIDTGSFTRYYRASDSQFFTQPLVFGSEAGEQFSYTGGNTFTPVLNVNGSDVTISTKQGRHKTIGKMVFFKVALFDSSVITFAAGDVLITGMPVAIAANPLDAVNVRVNTINGLTAGLTVSATMSGTTLTLRKDSAGTKLTGTDMNGTKSNTYLELTGWYFTA